MLTKLLSVRDYAPGMAARKPWELELAFRTLDTLGALRSDAVLLGVGAGIEPTTFDVSPRVKHVYATDLYDDPGIWHETAPRDMLTNPGKYAPTGRDYDLGRITARHMDARHLDFEDESIDGIYSCGSIEHVGEWEDIAQAAREIGRVLKPGGVASLCTEFKLSGDGDGFPGVKLFDRQALIDYLIAPSGLKPHDNKALKFTTDAETLAVEYSLVEIVRTGVMPPLEAVLTHAGYRFTSVHLALVKPKGKG